MVTHSPTHAPLFSPLYLTSPHPAQVTHSILGPDSGVGSGECHHSLVGPFVGFHHQALLIAAIWPLGRGNVGYGANVGSNHTSRQVRVFVCVYVCVRAHFVYAALCCCQGYRLFMSGVFLFSYFIVRLHAYVCCSRVWCVWGCVRAKKNSVILVA